MDNYEMSVWMKTKALANTLLLRDVVPVPRLRGTCFFFMSRLS